MSTATSTSSSSRRYVGYDEFIDYQLQKTRAGIKSNDLLTALIGAAVVVLAYVLVFAVFDHWVIEGGFGRGTRIGLLAALLTGLTVWFVWKLAIPWFRPVSALYAAREIEQTEPEFRGTLLTLIDLKEAGRPIPPELRAALEKRAGLSLTHMNVEEAVDRRLLMRLSYVLLGLVVITCLYTVFSPKKLSNSLWRSLLPTSAVAVDTRTRIDQVKPGDVDVLARSQLEVTAELSGQMPDEVVLLYSTQDGRLVDERIVMRETEEGLREFRGIITGERARGILQNLTYRIVAGDARSETYSVTVTQPPSATVDEVQYEFPAYMATRGRTQIGGAVDAWEGTWVTVRATANMPIESALVKFSDSDDLTQRAEEIPVTINEGTQLTARWQLRIRSDGTYPHFYRIECRDDVGKTDPSPTLYPIKIRPDLPPEIQLVKPETDIERPANAVVPLLYAAQDRDFLLRSVILRLERNGENLLRSPRLFEGPPDRKSVTGTYDFDLSELNLQAGDTLTYWLEARDNMEPFADRAGNRSNTPRLNITIIEPAPPEDVQQQLEEDRRQIEERLEEAQQQANEAGDDAPPPTDANDSGDTPSTPPDGPTPTDEPPADAAAEDDAPQSGQPGDQSQPQSGGKASETTGRQKGEGQSSSASSTDDAQQQQSEQPNESGEGGDSQAHFDDLLKELMRRQQQQPQPGEDAGSPADQQSTDRQTGDAHAADQQRGDQQQADQQQSDQPAADQSQPGAPSEGQERPSAAEGAHSDRAEDQQADRQQGDSPQAGPQQADPQQGSSSEKTSPAGGDQSPAGGDATTPPDRPRDDGTGPSTPSGTNSSPADPSQPSQPGEASSDPAEPSKPGDASSRPPQPGEGTEPSPTAENLSPRQDRADGTDGAERGQPTQDAPVQSDPARDNATPNGAPREGAKPTPSDRPEQGTDPTQPNENLGQPNSSDRADQKIPQDGRQPSAKPTPSDSRGAGNREQTPRPDSPQQGPRGEDSGSQQSPTDQQPDSPPSSGDASQQPGQPGDSPQKGGQPGSAQQDGGRPGSQSPDASDQPPSGGESSPSISDRPTSETPSPAGANESGEQSTQPGERSADSQGDSPREGEKPRGGPQPGGGDAPAADRPTDPPAPQDAQASPDGRAPQGEQPAAEGEKPSAGRGQPQGDSGGGQPPSQPGGSPQPGEQGGPGGQPQGSSRGSEGRGSNYATDPSAPAPGARPNAGEQPGPGTGEGEAAADAIQADDPDLEHKKKAAELVLKRLEEQLQRGEIDPQLREELGVTEEEMRDFTDRLRQRLADTGEDHSPEAQARHRQFQETLRSIDFESSGTERAGGDGPREHSRGYTGPQRTAPLKLRDATRAYRERLSRQRPVSN